MRILLIGDVVGRPGKRACARLVPQLIRDRGIDCVIANAENVTAGSGMTPQNFEKLRHVGIDVCTMGDHIYRKREIIPLLQTTDRIVRPANLPPEAAGRSATLIEARNGETVAVVSLLGRMYLNMRADCPFHAIDRILGEVLPDVRIVIVDMHAEATAEKIAMGWHLDGRATVVFGTHTHVQTADERILPNGTAYITDLGMTGPYDSVLGRDKENVLRALVTGMPHPYHVAHDDVRLCGAIVDVDATTGKAVRIERLCLPAPDEAADDEDD